MKNSSLNVCFSMIDILYLQTERQFEKNIVREHHVRKQSVPLPKNSNMPTTKNALIRYYHLDKLLSDSHHYYDRKDLTEKVNDLLAFDGFKTVEKRTIEKDIVNMQYAPFNATIKEFKWNGKNCVTYIKRSFSIFKEELSDEE